MKGCTAHCGCVMVGNGVRCTGVLVVFHMDFVPWICTCRYTSNKRNTEASAVIGKVIYVAIQARAK